jgi:hypothetical protein
MSVSSPCAAPDVLLGASAFGPRSVSGRFLPACWATSETRSGAGRCADMPGLTKMSYRLLAALVQLVRGRP